MAAEKKKIDKTKNAKKQTGEKLEEIIEVPAEINAEILGNEVMMKKENKEIRRKVDSDLSISLIEGNKIRIYVENAKKDERRKFGTAKSHLRNMIEGLMKGFEYELEVCNIHFPINVNFDKAKKEFIIKNFIGERAPRILKIKGDMEIEVKMPVIKIKSYDLEKAGQVAADLEKITKIRNRDRNKFQDGIFITKKPGVNYL